MRHVITGVLEGSVAQRRGLRVGDVLLKINGEDVIDEIDYQALSAQPSVVLTFERNGATKAVTLHKGDWEPIGLRFGDSMVLRPRTCRNNCVFCFIDQMPPRLRSSFSCSRCSVRTSRLPRRSMLPSSVIFSRSLRRRMDCLTVLKLVSIPPSQRWLT